MKPRLLLRAPAWALTGLALAGLGCGDEETIPLVINAFQASASEVDAAQTVTLTWDVAGAAGVSISASPGGVLAQGLPGAGTRPSARLDLNTTFTLTATSAGGEVAKRTVSVSVRGISIVRFTATPPTVGRGESSTLQWELGGSPPSEVLLVNGMGQNVIMPSTSRTGMVQVQPTRTETFTLRAQAGGVRAEQAVTVTVQAQPPRIVRFEATQRIGGMDQVVTAVAPNSTVNLRWTVENVNEVQISANGRVRRPWNSVGAMMGNSPNAPADQTRNVYVLEARNGPNPEDVARQEIVVETRPLPVVDRFTLTPTEFAESSTIANVSWATTGADRTQLTVDNMPVGMFPGTASGNFSFAIGTEGIVALTAINAVGETVSTQMLRFGYGDRETNDTIGRAIPLPGDGAPARGTLSTPADVDLYAVMVPAGSFIVASVSPAPDGNCGQLQASLALLDARGRELGQRTASTVTGPCVNILPTEFAGFAEKLTAGTYYLRVGQAMGATTGRYSIDVEVFELSAPLPNVSVTRVGDPTWRVTDFINVSARWGSATMSFPELLPNVAAFFGTRHTVEGPNILTSFGRPLAASVSDFSQELRTMLEVLGYTSKVSFTAAEWNPPFGLLFGYTVVPVATSTGTSVDFPRPLGGPVLPNGILPISIAASIDVNGMTVGELPGAPQILGDATSDGLSHMNVVHAIGAGAFAMPPPLPIDVVWNLQLRDNARPPAGYDVSFPFSVSQ